MEICQCYAPPRASWKHFLQCSQFVLSHSWLWFKLCSWCPSCGMLPSNPFDFHSRKVGCRQTWNRNQRKHLVFWHPWHPDLNIKHIPAFYFAQILSSRSVLEGFHQPALVYCVFHKCFQNVLDQVRLHLKQAWKRVSITFSSNVNRKSVAIWDILTQFHPHQCC